VIAADLLFSYCLDIIGWYVKLQGTWQAMLVHPDKNGGNEKAEEAFKRLQNAYEVSCIHLVAFESWVFWQLKKQGTFCVWQI
jgi:hypothetical protein